MLKSARKESNHSTTDEDGKVSRNPQEPSTVVDDPAAFDAASEEIAECIADGGSVSAAQCMSIIERKSSIAKLIRSHFPGSEGSSYAVKKAISAIEKRGLCAENTLFAQSICPDEINHEEGDLPNLFADYFGKVFHMGGLAGIPFTGSTGFAAFSHHVPDNGHCFVLVAPHIGLSDKDFLGQYSRDGQSKDGAACGAAVGALAHCCSGKPIPDLSSSSDSQMCYIINEVNKRKEELVQHKDANTKQAALVSVMADVAVEMMNKVVSVEFGNSSSTLVILTGIQINMPRPFEDYFQPLSFEMRLKDGTMIDLFSEIYGSIHNRTKYTETAKKGTYVEI